MKKEILSETTRKALSEVYLILQFAKPDLKKKVSPKFMKFVEENRMKEYIPKLDKSKPIEEQDFLDETYAFIAKVYIDNFCKSKEEKVEFLKLLKK